MCVVMPFITLRHFGNCGAKGVLLINGLCWSKTFKLMALEEVFESLQVSAKTAPTKDICDKDNHREWMKARVVY